MPATKRTEKPAARTANPRKRGRRTRPTEYEDEITREQIEGLNRIVPDDEFAEFKTVSGPAW
jgi:hypothetical protein